jgi:hypothetical protein
MAEEEEAKEHLGTAYMGDVPPLTGSESHLHPQRI